MPRGDRELSVRMPKDANGATLPILQPGGYAKATISDTAAAIDISSLEDVGYLVADVAINYILHATENAVSGDDHYLPADTVLPLETQGISRISVVAAVSGDTGTATYSELK